MTKWIETINFADLWDAYTDEVMTFEQVRDQVVARLHASRWAKQAFDIPSYIDDYISVAENVKEFDDSWNILLSMANADAIWLETRRS